MNTISRLAEKLSDPEYRRAFVASQINIGIPFQIRALLKARHKTQQWLAQRTGMLQPRISGLITPGRTRPNIETLRRLAEAFDCGLAVRFVPFSELARWSDSFDPEDFDVPEFKDDVGFIERKPIVTATDDQVRIVAETSATEEHRVLGTTTDSSTNLLVFPGPTNAANAQYRTVPAGGQVSA